MAGTVTSQLTNITLAESGDAGNWDDFGSGPGGGQSSDLPIQGAEAYGRRIDNAVKGFSYDTTAATDISGTGVHVGFWVTSLQPALINADGIELILGDNAAPKAGNWDGHFYDETAYPGEGGWVRVWLDPTRTRDTGSGTLTLSSTRQFGCEFDMGNVGGNAPNCQMDRLDYTATGLLIDAGTGGAPGVFSDLADDDADTTNSYGVVRAVNGVNFVHARITIADATATVFNDSGFAVVFADQRLCASDFMGITIDLQNASTDIDLANGIIRSGGTINSGDFIVAGTSGALDADAVTFDTIRQIDLTSACAFVGCRIANSGQIDAGSGADLTNCTIAESTAASALLWNVATDTDGKLDDCIFVSSGTGHAIEFGSSTPASVTLVGHTYTGYAGTDGSTGDETIYNNSGAALTINVTGGNTPTIRNGAGASTTVVNTVTLTVYVIDEDGVAIVAAQAAIYEGTTELMNEDTIAGGVATETYAYTADTAVSVRIRKSSTGTARYLPYRQTQTITNQGLTLTATLVADTITSS